MKPLCGRRYCDDQQTTILPLYREVRLIIFKYTKSYQLVEYEHLQGYTCMPKQGTTVANHSNVDSHSLEDEVDLHQVINILCRDLESTNSTLHRRKLELSLDVT